MGGATRFICRAMLPLALALAGAAPAHAAQQVTETVSVGATCTSSGQLCAPASPSGTYASESPLSIVYTAAGTHCSKVALVLLVDGRRRVTTGFTGPAGTVAATVPWPLDGREHALSAQALGQTGGCNSGAVASWAGSLSVTYTPVPKCALVKRGAIVAAKRRSCRLNVSIRLSGAARAGLALDASKHPGVGRFYETDPAAGCLSGCTAVQVGVTDDQHQPASAARLSASVTGFPAHSIAVYPAQGSGRGHLCRASLYSDCGTAVAGVPVNSEGRNQLLYWAPGAIAAGSVRVTVKAEQPCPICAGGVEQGQATVSLRVSPSLVFSQRGEFSDADTFAIYDWAKDSNFFSASNLADMWSGQEVSGVLTKAEALLIGEAAAANVSLAGTILQPITQQNGQEQAFAGLFSERLRLLPFGIGAPDATGLNSNFVSAIARQGHTVLHFGPSNGLMAEYGARLQELNKKRHIPHDPQVVSLQIYDVSYCPVDAPCGPRQASGIAPYLYFVFRGGFEPSNQRLSGAPSLVLGTSFAIPYNPAEWDPAPR